MVRWRTYTRRRGLKLDLVILDERVGDAADWLRAELEVGPAAEMLGKPDGVFFLIADQVPADDKVLLSAAARAVLGGGHGSLTDQIEQHAGPGPLGQRHSFRPVATTPVAQHGQPPDGLSFWNGFGGFTPDGREYVIVIDGIAPAQTHVAAGSLDECARQSGVRMSGDGGWSWLQLGGQQPNESPQPVVQRSDFGSARRSDLLRDEETGDFWTPTPLPLGPRATVTVRHGQGYTRYTHVSGNLQQDLLVFVPPTIRSNWYA